MLLLKPTPIFLFDDDCSYHRLLMHIQSSNFIVNDPHGNLRKNELRLTWIPQQSETVIRASHRRERQLGVPAGIPIHLTSRLMAPSKLRSLCQPTVASYSTFSSIGVL